MRGNDDSLGSDAGRDIRWMSCRQPLLQGMDGWEAEMIHWYHDLYMDQKVRENPRRCKHHIQRCAGSLRKSLSKFWKSYYVITLPSNDKNLFDIMETKQFFFRRYAHLDLYIVGLAENYDSALELLQQILLETAGQGEEFTLRSRFDKSDFTGK